MTSFSLLFLGVILLILGTRLAVKQALLISSHYRLSDFFVGVVILAAGSDLPEIVISVNAALHQTETVNTSGIIIGNVLGSNFTQIGLIMGISGLYGYLTMSRQYIFLHGGILLGSILFLQLAGLDGRITRQESFILILAFLIYGLMLFGEEERTERPSPGKAGNIYSAWLYLLLGLGFVIGGSELTVKHTVLLAESAGISQAVIAIVIIGTGSSLPELAISIGSLMKARGGMSVGNLIGSNIIDTLLPVGLAGLIHPFQAKETLFRIDLSLLFLFTFLVLGLFLRQRGLQKKEAGLILACYGLYIFYKISGY